MITSTNITSGIVFQAKQKAKPEVDTSIYPTLLLNHDYVSIALNTESEKKEIVGLHVNAPGIKPITIWKPEEGLPEILIFDYNFRNGRPFTIGPKDPNYARLKGLINHHIKNYERENKDNTDNVNFTGALKAQALLRV